MSGSASREIEVWADWTELGGPRRMGVLHIDFVRGKEVHAFAYDDDWLESRAARVLDPHLRLDPRLGTFPGRQHPPAGVTTFGLFMDSAPDRWGRTLMNRRELLRAREESRSPRPLRDSDYLLGVHDSQRMGALRFRLESSGPFLDDDPRLAAPPWTHLRQLQHASLHYEKDGAGDDPRGERWLRQLLGPGSSLGGARPKAGVVDEKGALWIAKFPSRQDTMDHGAWEYLVHHLAEQAGLRVAPARMERLGAPHHVFLTRRFDRIPGGGRRHYASALTLLERRDGDDASTGASYLELADLLVRQGSATALDLEELWRRIVFFICIANTDDHLRNHGFLLESGWRLAPAFDMNPNPDGQALSLNIDETNNRLDLDLALSAAEEFRLKPERARSILLEVQAAASGWRRVAQALGLSAAEQELMAPAFQQAEKPRVASSHMRGPT